VIKSRVAAMGENFLITIWELTMIPTITRFRLTEYGKRFLVPIAAGLIVLFLALFLQMGYDDSEFTQRVEAIAYDLRLRATLPNTVDDRIVIIDIDEPSLAREGHWPWPREKLARMVDRLFEKGVAVLAFDIVFAESDENTGITILKNAAEKMFSTQPEFMRAIEALKPQLDRDAIFAKSLQGRPVVLSYYFNFDANRTDSVGILPAPAQLLQDLNRKGIDLPVAAGFGANLPVLQAAARGAGYITTEPDVDGNFRRIPMLVRYKNHFYAALALETARVYLGAQHIQPVSVKLWKDMYAVEKLILGDYEVPTDRHGRVFIPFRGREKSFPYISATDVLQGSIDKKQLEGKIVLVGTTAAGLKDLRSTPVQADYPGVEAHASVISAILDTKGGQPSRQRFYQRPSWAPGADAVILLILGLILVFLLPRLTVLPAAFVTLGAASLLLGLNMLMWLNGVVLALAIPLLFILVLFTLSTVYGYLIESRSRRTLMGVFGQYVPPALVDEMSQGAENFGLEGESREMTVLFSDIRGFTAMAESLTPGELKNLLNRFFTPMTRIIHAHRGTIDKYVGDLIMAFWGAPLHDDQHARHALEAAMQMLEREAELKQEFEQLGLPAISIGIGLNTGNMNVGNMGSEFRMAYTVIGDAVNLASRLEGLTRVYDVGLVVSEATRAGHADLLYRELDRVRVKGKQKAVTIYQPIAYNDRATPELRQELNLYHQALRLYRDADWDLAELQFLALSQKYPECRLYHLYIERIQYFRTSPPAPEWRGVFDYTSK